MKKKLRVLLYGNGSLLWKVMAYLWMLGAIGWITWAWPHGSDLTSWVSRSCRARPAA